MRKKTLCRQSPRKYLAKRKKNDWIKIGPKQKIECYL